MLLGIVPVQKARSSRLRFGMTGGIAPGGRALGESSVLDAPQW